MTRKDFIVIADILIHIKKESGLFIPDELFSSIVSHIALGLQHSYANFNVGTFITYIQKAIDM